MYKPCRQCKSLIPANIWHQHQDQHKNESRPSHWSSPGARASRAEALRRDGNRCQVCGRTADQLRSVGQQLHVHHIIEKADGGSDDASNLKVLCEDHHERGGVPFRYR